MAENRFAVYEELPLVLTVEQLASILNIGRNAAYELVRTQRIETIRVGKQIRITREALWDFLKIGRN